MKKKVYFFFALLLLFCQEAFCGNDYSTSMTLYVGSTKTLTPKSSCGASYCFSTSIYYDSESFHVERISQTNSLGMQNVNGSTTGTYSDFKITALKAGKYTVTCRVQYYESISGYKSKSNTATYTITVKEVPKVVSISIPSDLSFLVGVAYTFSPIIYETGASTTLTWSSSNPAVAVIDANGTLTTKGTGTTTIICTASNGVSAQCVVTVNPVLANSVALNVSQVDLVEKEKFQLSATTLPENTTNKGLTWSSSNVNVATVNENGLVTAVAPGQSIIMASTTDGSNKSAKCQVDVLSNWLYTEDAVGVASGILVLPVYLRNVSPITGLQFELDLPDGVIVAENEAGKSASSMSDRVVDQSITCSRLSNGNYQFVVFSTSSTALNGNEGAIAYVTLNVAADVLIGEYSIGVKNVELTTTNSESLYHKDLSSKLTITEATIGDTNGDGRITVTDAVSIVNYILERAPSVFITKAADVNGDGAITISDAVNVINQILNK